MITLDCQSFLDWCEGASDDTVEHLLETICEGESKYGVRITSTHRIDVINHVYSGEADVDGETFSFVVESGNMVGCAVYEWCHPDDAEGYSPPPPTIYIFVPRDPSLERDRPQMYEAYLAWRELDWFKEKEQGYNYDKHFAPGTKTETHYREWAKKLGLRIAVKEAQ